MTEVSDMKVYFYDREAGYIRGKASKRIFLSWKMAE